MKKWIQVGDGGYWSIDDAGTHHTHKLPLFCPHEECRRPTGTVDDKYMREYGVCYTCYTMYIEERQTPAIDVEYYQARLKERGY